MCSSSSSIVKCLLSVNAVDNDTTTVCMYHLTVAVVVVIEVVIVVVVAEQCSMHVLLTSITLRL